MTKETRQQVQYLLARYINGNTTPSEESLLFTLINQEESSEDWEEMMEELIMLQEADDHYDRDRWQPVVEKIVQGQQPARKKIYQLPAWRIAASLLLVLAVAAWFWFNDRHHQQVVAVQPAAEIAPGKDGAILTLSDGSKMVLDSIGNGVIATQSGTKIVLENGQLTYRAAGSEKGTVLYNTMTVPRKRQFRLSLPDSSKVWLNAESSIRYPAYFSGSQRKVEITGEVYFEVAKKADQPFVVEINQQTSVLVLGTHFNINAYNNEPAIRTTLLEGSIRFTHAAKQLVLKPGQQVQAGQSGNTMLMNDADIDKVMAWKNGAFNFEGAGMEEVMRQLERWYDIDVVYEKGIPDKVFVGEIGRNISLDELLKGLKGMDIHCTIQGRTLTVLP